MSQNYWELYGLSTISNTISMIKTLQWLLTRALLSIPKENRSNNCYNSRLSRWIERLLPYNFSIDHMPRAKMGLVDYFSRIPFAQGKKILENDENFVVLTISKVRHSLKQTNQPTSSVWQKLNTMIKPNTPSSKLNKSFALQTPISKSKSLQLKNKLVTSWSRHSDSSSSYVLQFTLPFNRKEINLNTSIWPKMPLSHSKPQFAK